MMQVNRLPVLALFVATSLGLPGNARPLGSHHLVACAPGYPGNTSQAQPTMNRFADMVAEAAGWDDGALTAEYQEQEAQGLLRLTAPTTDLALVPLPFFLAHENELQLDPLLQVVQQDGHATEVWSLVAARGSIGGPEDLAGWQITGVPAYDESFVRGPALGSWGALPDSVEIVVTRRVLGALRRAAAGEHIAVLLDRAQTAALQQLPDPTAYEVVATSAELPAAVVASVGGRIGAAAVAQLRTGLLQVHEQAQFEGVLGTLRLRRFEPLDLQSLDRVRATYRGT